MCDPATLLAEHAGRGATAVVLGDITPDLCEALTAALGPTGLLVVCHPRETGRCGASARIRSLPTAAGILSHAADALLVIAGAEEGDPVLVAVECRRLLAPRGALRALLPHSDAARLAAALRRIPFRDVEVVSFGPMAGIRASGPR